MAARLERFTFLCNEDERQIVSALAERLQRSQSDAMRLLIREAAQEMESKNQLAHDAEAETSRVAQQPVVIKFVSNNQNGGITAQNVYIQGGISQTTFDAGEQKKVQKPLRRVLSAISPIVRFLADLIKILGFFKIPPF